MGFFLATIISVWVLPPAIFIVMLALSVYWWRKKPRRAHQLVTATLILLTSLSLPIVSGGLMSAIEAYPALSSKEIQQPRAQAIVVLSAGRKTEAPEYGNLDTVDRLTLDRMRYAARLHRQTGLPILVTGGAPLSDRVSLASLMTSAFREDFNIEVKWQEAESRNTAENAEFSARILKQNNINNIFLVTHAWHMRRSIPVFERTGISIIPAPTVFEGYRGTPEFIDFIPSADALHDSFYALHETIGYLWYLVRY